MRFWLSEIWKLICKEPYSDGFYYKSGMELKYLKIKDYYEQGHQIWLCVLCQHRVYWQGKTRSDMAVYSMDGTRHVCDAQIIRRMIRDIGLSYEEE